MSLAHEVDLGPLTWVKGEIDLALARAAEALSKYSADSGGTNAQLKFAQTHLHQARGALAIVGLDGLTHFAETLEQLIGECERGKLSGTTPVGLCGRALEAIRDFLDELASGGPNQPLRLFALYQEMQRTRGQEHVSPSDLFYPDLAVRPPKRDTEQTQLSGALLMHHVRFERGRFERGFLQWLRSGGGTTGIAEMRNAVAAIERSHSLPASRAFWWATLAFLDALDEKCIPLDLHVKRLCARIDAQMRRLVDGSRTVAERLMRDVLYYVAVAQGGPIHVKQVKELYRLDDLIPKPGSQRHAKGLTAVQVRELRDSIAGLKDCWDRFCTGTAIALPQFDEQVGQFVRGVKALEELPLARMADALSQLTQWLRRDPLRHNDSVAIEVATSLLLAENIIEAFDRCDADTVAQAGIMADRLAALQRGEALAVLQAPTLGEMSQRAQENLVLSQVAREIQTNLAEIERTLDAYFRDPSRRTGLNQLGAPIKQVMGALTMLNQDEAVDLLRECESRITGFTSAGDVSQDQFEDVAQRLSALGFFVESLHQGRANPALLRPAPASALVEEPEAADGVAATVEQELEQQKRDTQALVVALRDKPEDDSLRRELKQNLELIRQDANLLADAALEQQAEEALAALASAPSSPVMEEAIADIVQTTPDTSPLSAEVARLADSSEEEIDAELLGIFLEEAHDVLNSIGEHHQQSLSAPHDHETLTVIRRGFHTLKGSGRMVGLKDLGETAWAIEQVMNRWLQQEKDATPSLHTLIGDAHALMSRWVAQLEVRGGLSMDSHELLTLAEQLKTGDEPAQVIAHAQTAPATVGAETVPSLEGSELGEAQALPQPTIEQPDLAEVADLDLPLVPDTAEAVPALELAANDEAMRATSVAAATEDTVTVGDLVLSRGLYEMFLTEARTHIATLRREFASLHLDPVPSPSDATHRAAHTLGGISGTVGFEQVARLARAVEHALTRIAESGHAPDLLNATAASLEEMVHAVAERHLPPSADELIAKLEYIAIPPVVAPTAPESMRAVIPTEVARVAKRPEAEVDERRRLRLQDDIDQQLLPIFLDESQDLVREIGNELRQWHAEPQDRQVPQSLARLLHTLKGSARMAGAMGLGELVHGMESRIEQAVARNAVTSEFLEEFDNSFDRANYLLDQLRHGETPSFGEAPEPITPDADVTASAPAVSVPAEVLEQVEVDATQQRASLRVRADLVDRFVNEAGEMSIARARIEGEMRAVRQSLLDLTENVIRLRRQLREIEIQAETQMQSRMALAEETRADFDPLEFDRFTLFQELTRMMAESVNDVSTVQHSLLKNLDGADAALVNQARINRDLAQALMRVRMVPFNSVADRLYRVVRQTAKELGKKANLDIRGGQIELDRSVLEKTVAPLEHLLRNAISHGLEPLPVRQALGKPDIGQIQLQISQEGNEVAIELADDGAGLDFERIRTKAVALGMIGENESPDEQRLTDLIFAPGFSTAVELSAVAGRGIGMDVVKNQATELGGRIEAKSERRKGARFRVYLPQSLAVTQALIVRGGGMTYAIPSTMVVQVMELKPDAFDLILRRGAAEWLGNQYPYHYLPKLLGESDAAPQSRRYYWVLLVRSGAQRVAVHVDDLRGNQEIVLKSTGPQLARVPGVTGVTVLGNGDVVLILNPVALAYRKVKYVAALAPAQLGTLLHTEPAVLTVSSTVMVVDDSLTVRKITGKLLEREGYRVLTAKDGVDALEQLLDTVPNVMMVDIEMPRMDGFDLTRNVRADPRLKHIPIIMVTSRTAEKHRNYAKEIGVNHYLGKPYQEEELLAKIAEYVGVTS